jgi:riboflavin kinase/FMN adenylyltransferase
MKVIPVSSPEVSPSLFPHPIAAAIGNFDGVHLGHAFLIGKMFEAARDINALSAVCTFDPLPVRFFGGDTPMISPLPQRLALLEHLGVELCILLDFSTFALLEPEDFFRILSGSFGVGAIAVGKDFRFGKGRAGDSRLLSEFCKREGITLCTPDKITAGGVDISSSHIRELVTLGNVEDVPEYLGRLFCISGVVTEGDKIGRTIGFPTANLRTENELIPPAGVYGGNARLRRGKYKALIYIGARPTVNGGELRIEANLQDYSANLYGETLELEFIRRIRGEMRFAGLEQLKQQIIKDRKQFNEYLG